MANLPCDEEAVFHAARRLRSPQERAEYLRGACGDDPALLARVEALLGVHDEDNSLAGVRLGPTADAVEAMPHPGALVGRYRLLEQIGEGGFGTVYMAEQQHPVRRRVALKVIKPGMDTRQVIARFEAERQALALMDHPNIAKVLDAGATDTGRPYFVMELVKGVPITNYCDQNNLSPRQRLELFVQVCHAVQHAHQKGVIHRDLKPGNVLVTLHDARPVPKVIDFGIAKATGQQLTEKTLFTNFAQMVGTPLYMSPEQAALSAVDADTRSDVYSLGVLLYELLTGTTPFDKERLKQAAWDEVRRIIREEQPPKPSTRIGTLGATLTAVSGSRATEPEKLGPLVRGELDCIVMKALEKQRDRRYETANALAVDVRHYLNDEPVSARPASAAYRLRKFASKHKAGFGAAAAVAAALVLGAAGTTLMAVRATRDRDRAVTLSGELDRQRREALDAKAAAENAKTSAEVAKARAERERAAAEDSEGHARYNLLLMRTVLGFVGDMFTVDDPARRDRDLTVAQMLDRNVDQISGRHPVYVNRCEALIRLTLGTAYEGVDRPADAEREFRKVLAHTEDHPYATGAMSKLGALLAEQGRFAEALPVLERAMDKYRAADEVNSDSLATLKTAEHVAHSMGRRSEAERYGKEVADVRGRLGLDESAPPLADALGKAYTRIARNDFSTAEVFLRRGIELHRQLKAGQEDRTFVALHHNLGLALAEEGSYAEAETAYCQALAASERLLGKDHPEAGPTLAKLAAVLRAQRKADQAGAAEIRYLAIQVRVLTDTISHRPADASLYSSRAHSLCRMGRFSEAIGDFDKAIELEPGDHWRWYYRGCLLAHSRQSDAYRAHCQAMLRQFGGSKDQFVADRTAKTCLVLPDATRDLAAQLLLVDVVFGPGMDKGAMPWFRLLKGLAEYRRGNEAAAADWLEQSRKTLESKFVPARVTATLLLAMAHHRLGHSEQARAMFSEGRQYMDRDMPRAGAEDLGPVNVEDWLISQVISREAEAVFAGG